MVPVAPMEFTHGVVKYGLQRKGERVLTGGLIEFFLPGQSVLHLYIHLTSIYSSIYIYIYYLGPPGVRKPSLAIFSVRSLLNQGGANLCVPDTRVTFLPIPRSGGVRFESM